MALDYDMEMSKTSEPSFLKKFTLPDGKEISVGQETFMCPEVLFNPSLVGESRVRGQWFNGQSEGRCGSVLASILLQDSPALKFPWYWLLLSELPPTLLLLC